MISSATVIGRGHRIMQKNCQDFAITREPCPETSFGLVLDGCGSRHLQDGVAWGSSNEIGAYLLGEFAADYLESRLVNTDDFVEASEASLQLLVDDLHEATMAFLDGLLTLFPSQDHQARTRFTATHLLCTLLGFVKLPDSAVFFWSGDGFLCQNSEVYELDSTNKPNYLAYQMLSGNRPEEARFSLRFLKEPERLTHLSVATDGWDIDSLEGVRLPRPGHRLQRWLNVTARERGRFEDDGALAVWWSSKSDERLYDYA